MPISLIPQKVPTHRSLGETLQLLTGGSLLVAFSLFLLFVAVASYIGLTIYQARLNSALQKDNEVYANLQQGSATKDQQQAADFAQRAQHIKALLATHINANPLFSFLENYTHKQVTWTNLSFDSSKGALKLQGVTSSYRSLAEQMALWQKTSLVQHASASDFILGNDGLLRFSAALQLPPGAFVASSF